MVAVRGLHRNGEADLLRHFPGLIGVADDLALGHGHAAGGEQPLGEILVLGDALGDGAGLVALGGPDAALRGAVAQLHQVAVVQADVRNAPGAGGVHDAAGAGAQVAVVDGGLDGVDGGLEVECLVIDGGHQQTVAMLQRHAGHGLFGAAEHHAVHAAPRDLARLAELGRHAREVEQFDDHVLQHVPHPGAFLQAQQEAAALAHAAVVLHQIRQPGGQALVEAGNLVGGVVFQLPQVQPDFEDRAVGPDTGTAQVGGAQELDIVEFGHEVQRGRFGYPPGSGECGDAHGLRLCADTGAAQHWRVSAAG